MSQTIDLPSADAPLAAAPHPEISQISAGSAFPQVLVRTLLETLRMPEKENPAQLADRQDAAVTVLAAIDTRDPVEMMFAAHAVASHHATMECFRRAMLATGNPDVATRMHKSAVTLSRMMAENLRTLDHKHANAAELLASRNRGGKTP